MKIRAYLLAVSATALFVSLVTAILPDGRPKKIVYYLGSMAVLLAVVKPVLQIDISAIRAAASKLEQELTAYEVQAAVQGQKLLEERIMEACETYILDKAKTEGLSVKVSVLLDSDAVCPKPNGVVITGQLKPEQRKWMEERLVQDLGIPREAQKWVEE